MLKTESSPFQGNRAGRLKTCSMIDYGISMKDEIRKDLFGLPR